MLLEVRLYRLFFLLLRRRLLRHDRRREQREKQAYGYDTFHIT